MKFCPLIASLFAASAAAAPAGHVLPRADSAEGVLLPPGRGRHGGFYYEFWSDKYTPSKANDAGPILYRNLEGGRYKVQWNEGTGNFVAGKGWNSTDADKVKSVTYNATFSASGTSYLSLYGWMTTPNPKWNVEYYIIDNWIKYHPAQGERIVGTVETDGAVYDIRAGIHVTMGLHDPDWRQIFSVRREKRTAGTISREKHLEAWKALGESFDSHTYSVMAVEGYRSTGEADVTVLSYEAA
ncbi:hypothetical protein OQA88_2044 [Cercophora sp. LCS_1]